MALVSLEARGFRSLGSIRLEFDPAANYLFGPNGSGKTSILEAVHYAATGRSFRTRRDSELLGFGAGLLSVTAEDERGRLGRLVFDGCEKRFELDGSQFTRLSEFFGWLPVVPLLLGDVELVAGPPALRRDYLDMAAAKADRSHIGALNGYRRAQAQYCRLLASCAAADQLEAWEAEVARHGAALSLRRIAIARFLLRRAEELAERLAGRRVDFRLRSGADEAMLRGDDCGTDRDPRGGGDALAATLRDALAGSRRRAFELGRAVVGPHRDDIAVRVGGRSLRRFGSVGEQRTASIALRLAEADYLREHVGQRPVFLMDEIASELDAGRSAALFEHTGGAGQTVYAAARPFAVGGRVFNLDNGQVR